MDEVSRAIGGLQASVEALRMQWADQDRKAAEGRKILHDKMDTVTRDVGDLKSQVNQLRNDVTQMQPVVRNYETVRQQAIGSRRVLAAIWGGIITVTAAMSAVAVEVFHAFFGKH